jgi:hypothetical protein
MYGPLAGEPVVRLGEGVLLLKGAIFALQITHCSSVGAAGSSVGSHHHSSCRSHYQVVSLLWHAVHDCLATLRWMRVPDQ